MQRAILFFSQKKIIWCSVVLLLLFQFCFLNYLAKADSQTIDEGVHLSAGYTYLVNHDYRLNTEHPPVVKLLCALPLLRLHPDISTFTDLWNSSANFYYDSVRESYGIAERFLYNNNASLLLYWGRFSNIILTMLLGLVIFFISKRFWGNLGGLFSLGLFVFDPNILAHGHLITTDIGASLGYLLSIYCLYRYFNHNNWQNLIWLGLSLGLAFSSKYTMLMILPIGAVLVLLKSTFESKKPLYTLKVFAGCIAALLIAWFVIWASYGFETKPIPENSDYATTILTLNNYPANYIPQESKDNINNILGSSRNVLIPREFFKGSFQVISHVNGGHSSFLLGQVSDKGWWYYFPVMFWFKTTLGALILFAALVYFYIRRGKSQSVWFFGCAALFYLLVAMTSKANLGLRHILPMYPLLYVIVPYIFTVSKKINWLILASIILIFAEFIYAFPNCLSFFNVFASGPYGGYRIAGDSNLEWGQDSKRIKTYIDEHYPSSTPYVMYWWTGGRSLEYYGLRHYYPQPPYDLSNILIIGQAERILPEYSWLNNAKLIDRVTPSVFVYDITGAYNGQR